VSKSSLREAQDMTDVNAIEEAAGWANILVSRVYRGPGDTVEFHMNLLRRRKNIWWYRGEAKVAGTLVAEATVSAMMSDR